MATVADKANRFMGRFNEDDLDGTVASLAPDAVYVDPYGATYNGREAIRASLAPYFEGQFGVVRYEVTEVIADEAAGRALVGWNMTIQAPDSTANISGLDILHFDGELITRKNSYCKASQVQTH